MMKESCNGSTRVHKYNEHRKLNELEPVGIDEFMEMERYSKAMELELARLKRRRKSVRLVLIVLGLAALAVGDVYIIEIIELLKNLIAI